MVTTRRTRPAVAVVSVDRPRTIVSSPRPEKARARGSARKALRNLSLFVLLGGAVGGVVFAFQSDTFRVRSVEVRGASPGVRTAVADLIVPGCAERSPGNLVCSENVLGPNEFSLNGHQMVQELNTLPAVKSASVRPALPDRLIIDITERQPAAAWVVGSEVFRVGEDGVVIDRGSPDGLKVVIGQVAGAPVKLGDKIDPDILHGAELLQSQLPSDFGITAKRIQYSPTDGLAVIGDGDVIAMFGQPSQLNLKMAELQRILQLAKDKKSTLAFVDLRYKTPYYRTR